MPFLPLSAGEMYRASNVRRRPDDEPFDPGFVHALTTALSRVSSIQEAFLPMFFVKDSEPRERFALLVVLPAEANVERTMERVSRELRRILPPHNYLDVLPEPPESILHQAARQANCLIYVRRKPWWEFW